MYTQSATAHWQVSRQPACATPAAASSEVIVSIGMCGQLAVLITAQLLAPLHKDRAAAQTESFGANSSACPAQQSTTSCCSAPAHALLCLQLYAKVQQRPCRLYMVRLSGPVQCCAACAVLQASTVTQGNMRSMSTCPTVCTPRNNRSEGCAGRRSLAGLY